MCGIIAHIGTILSPQQKKLALRSLQHRGPDGEGEYQNTEYNVWLGHRRLAIIDLVSGEQPLFNESRDIIAIVNGEFYNYREIRQKLVQKGHRFATKTDSEILLHLYEEQGLQCLEQLRGEFAFVLWDKRYNRIFAGRDRFGIKPLCYHSDNDSLSIASEAKALFALGVPAAWNSQTLLHCFHHQYPLPSQTMFAGIQQLPPGHFLVYQDNNLHIEKYWDFSFNHPLEIDSTQATQELEYKLRQAVRLRLQSDVDIGIYLSGGIDSASILALANQEANQALPCFGVAFSVEAYDESLLAAKIAAHCGSTYQPIYVSQDDLYTHLEAAVWQAEMLCINGQLPAKYLLSKHVQKAGIKVVLSGEGADEALFGYPHLKEDWLTLQPESDIASIAAQITRENVLSRGIFLPTATIDNNLPSFLNAKLQFGSQLYQLLDENQLIACEHPEPQKELLDYFADQLTGQHKLHRGAYLWTKLALANYILRAIGDGMEMSHSLEGRPPFLDHQLFDWCTKLPTHHKIHNGTEKYILRKAMSSSLPDWLCQRPKHPFIAPPTSLFQGSLSQQYLNDNLRSSIVKDIPFVCSNKVKDYLNTLSHRSPSETARSEPVLMLLLSTVALTRKIQEIS